ncbi:MAG: hypothetical protein ACKO0Z_14220 [Betaproteobacteria bacterium]
MLEQNQIGAPLGSTYFAGHLAEGEFIFGGALIFACLMMVWIVEVVFPLSTAWRKRLRFGTVMFGFAFLLVFVLWDWHSRGVFG